MQQGEKNDKKNYECFVCSNNVSNRWCFVFSTSIPETTLSLAKCISYAFYPLELQNEEERNETFHPFNVLFFKISFVTLLLLQFEFSGVCKRVRD